MSVHGVEQRVFAALVRRPVLLFTLLLTAIVIGVIAWVRIPIQMMPDGLVDPGLQVFVTNVGASAQENEEQVARVLEEELRTLPSVADIESNSRQDTVGIFVNFQGETDMNFAKAEVRDRIERARPKLPKTVRDIGIWSWSESDLPVLFFALLHPGDSERTDFLVENVIKRRLEAVDGVGRTEMWGLLDDSLRILLDEDRVRAAKLDLGALVRRLSNDNFALSMGEVQDGGARILLRSDMRFRSPEEIATYPVGGGLTLGDLAEVTGVKTVRESLFRVDGSFAYYGEVQKDGQANVVETAERLKAAIAELEKDPALRGEFKFLVLFDQGQFIQTSIKQLSDTAWQGGLLAVAILFLFLWRIRQTLLVALSIPVSVVLSIAWVYFTGGSFNVLTMTGITLAMGMLVDNAIVVIENITRLRADGRSERDAVVEGASGVALAVLLSTLTTVVVFLPLIFMTGNPILRIMFGELGLPLCVSLLLSLLVALVFMPVAAERALGPRPAAIAWIAARLAPFAAIPARTLAIGGRVLHQVARTFVRALDVLNRVALAGLTPLRWPLALAVVGLGAFAVVRALRAASVFDALALDGMLAEPVALGKFGWIALLIVVPTLTAAALCIFGLPRWRSLPRLVLATRAPRSTRGSSIVAFVVQANGVLVRWSLEHRLAATGCALLALFSVLIPMSKMTVSAFGEDDSKTRLFVFVDLEDNFTLPEASREMARYETLLETKRAQYQVDHIAARFSRQGGQLRLFWERPQTREHMDTVLADLRATLPHFPGHRLRYLDEMNSSSASKVRSQVTFRIRGPDSEELERLGAEGIRILEGVPGLTSISSPIENAPRQVRVVFDSDVAQKLGVAPMTALSNISWALRGAQLPSYQEPGREIPLIIEYDDTEVAGLHTLRDLEVMTGTSSVPLASFADLEFGHGSRSIYRRNGEATFTIQARVENPSRQLELSEQGYRALAALELPRGYSLGDDDSIGARQDEEFQELFAALMLSVVLVFLLMGILFESFMLPISVLFTIPYAVVGSYWTLYLTGTAMDSVGWIGIIILVGVVVNNGIVLIDRIHGLRAEGMERKAAVIEGCQNRVRPILMTALTSVIGLWPMAVTEPPGEGIDYRALATCVAGGLSLSTVFTLWVVPLAYTLIDDFTVAFAARMRWSLRKRAPSAELSPVAES